MKIRLKVDISLVLTFVILVNFGLIKVLTNDMSRSSGYEVVSIIAPSMMDDAINPAEYFIHHNLTRQFKPNSIIEYQQIGRKVFNWNVQDNKGRVNSYGVDLYQLLITNNQPNLTKWRYLKGD